MNLRKVLLVSSIIGNAACFVQAATPVSLTKDTEIEKKVEATLARMTLEEKVGQMTELSIDVLGNVVGGEFKLDKEKVKNAIGKYKVGSVLNAPGPVAQSREKWKEIIGYIQEVSMKEIGIPCIYGLDQTHGTTYTLGGTLFPQNINLGASFNPELTYESAVITAYETRVVACLGKLWGGLSG